MNKLLSLVAAVMLAGPSLAYLEYQRPVEVPNSGSGQHYLVIDEAIWQHARPDLADLRLYSGETEVPYAQISEQGSSESDRRDVRVLQQSSIGGKTQFLIDMGDIVEYDHVDLKLAAKDFVAHARVEGQDNLHGARWASLGDSILYDLSRESLGSNTMLRLPRSTYRYLRVTIEGPVQPRDVIGASAEHRLVQNPLWLDVGAAPRIEQQGKDTVFTFAVPENVPVERVVFTVDPAQPNFRREVEFQNSQKTMLGSGEINRIHMVRAGQKIDSDVQQVNFYGRGEKTIRVIVHNGDDPPLKITGARLQQHERRVYFDAPARSELALYYGDPKLESPVYDYDKLFQRDPGATVAQLGAETKNTVFTGRPDERPWSEKHPAVLWIAIVAAVLVLGALALRSMKTAAA